MKSFLNNIQAYVEALVQKYDVPALSMAIWQDDRLYKGAAGVLNIETGVLADTDSIFQIGSISKVFTASLIMQLVDEGRINLDQPVKTYLRDFHVACPDATESITVRQLLCHTSGMAGSFSPDDSAGDGNHLARYLDRCYLLPQVHPPGEFFSYANSAYCIAGRLVEVMSGLAWAEAIEECIVKPLGMQHVAVSPLQTLRFRTAIGHVVNRQDKNQWIPAPRCYLPLSMAPAGAVLAMSASDLITFAQVHMRGGRAPSGAQWLTEKSIQQMRTSQIKLPPHSELFITDWGLGWFLLNGGEAPVFGHDGVTIGQSVLLRIVPEKNLIFSILINGDRWPAFALQKALFCELMSELAGYDYHEPEEGHTLSHPEQYCGHYESFGSEWDVVFEQEKLLVTTKIKSLEIPTEKLVLNPIDENCFVGYSKKGKRQLNITFLSPDEDGRPAYLFSCFELCHRVS